MATKIKRCLYVGLGGTGMNALLHTKKSFIDTYGEVPTAIGFLGLDTDRGSYKKSLMSVHGDEVVLDPNEQLPIYVENARAVYEVNKDDMSWIPSMNVNDLDKMTLGAGQIRTNGRFAFTSNYSDVVAKVKEKLNTIKNNTLIDRTKYDLISNDVEIHMVFSLGGGTGCGTFINMAYMFRNEVPDCKLTGYAVLPDVFPAMRRYGMLNVKPNAYGAMCDLDYLMHMGISNEPFMLAYTRGTSKKIDKEPFDAVIFIDNQNKNNDTYTDIDQLTEMISLALVTSAGELSSATASVSDNLAKEIRKGSRNIENKKAWAAGMGICELIYRNSEISQIYAMKAAKILIERLFNSCEDTDTIVNAWIDSPEVNIRENNGNDHVIDFIAQKKPKYALEYIDASAPKSAVDLYLEQNKIKDEDVTAKVTELTTRVRAQLRDLLILHMNKECGVSTTANIIEGIMVQVDTFLHEMIEEKNYLAEEEPKYRTSVNTAMEDLKAYDGKFFKRKNTLEEKEEDLRNEAERLCICMREQTRRDAAIQVYNALKGILQEAQGKVNVISESLKAVSSKLLSDIVKKQNALNKETQTFQIDLAKSLITSLAVKPEEIQVAEFVRMLSGDRKIYGFGEYSSEEIMQFIMKYAQKLPTTVEYKNTTIDDVINRLSEEEFDALVKEAIAKSMPLLRYDYKGYFPAEQPQDSYYIGVRDKKNNRLAKNEYFRSQIADNADCDFANIGSTEKIIIYRVLGVLPAYSITSMDECRIKYYESIPESYHIDYNLYVRMQREDFSLSPRRLKDEDLLDLWVKGFIFGLIKNENGGYMLKSNELGDVLMDNWVELGKYRDDAFAKFRTLKSVIRKEFPPKFEEIAGSRGKDAMDTLLADVRANYLAKFSQIHMTVDQIKEKGFERIRELITDEIKLAQSL